MNKLKSLDELKKIRERANQDTGLRTTGENPNRTILAVGMATCGIAAGARPVMTALLDEVTAKGINDVSVIATGCLGFCYAEPLVEVRIPGREPVRYRNVTPELAKQIVEKHVLQGTVIEEAVLGWEGK
jgi:NADP-reducing hydrogenase subunit HndB